MDALKQSIETQSRTGIKVEGEVLFLVNGDCRVTRNQLATITNRSWRAMRYAEESGKIKPVCESGNKKEYALQESLMSLNYFQLAEQIKQKRILRLPPSEPMRKRKARSKVIPISAQTQN